MKVTHRTLLLGGFWLLVAVLTERVAHAAAASRADQYDARHGSQPPPAPPPQQPRREATDQRRTLENVLELNANPNRNHDNDSAKLSLIADADAMQQAGDDQDDGAADSRSREAETGMSTNELGEMQVGCGHGLFEVVPAPKQVAQGAASSKRAIRKRAIEKMKERRRRNYHSTYTVWQPPVYQLTRPYVIPVWGVQGQHPIYFPPQPIQPDTLGDPRKSYLPPNGYLPPKRTTTIGYEDDDYEDMSKAQGQEGNIALNNRNSFDDAPIWDIEAPIQSRPQTRPPIRTTPAPSLTQPRRTRRPGVRTTTPPALVHRSENNTNFNSNQRPNSLRPAENRPNLVEVPNFRPQPGGGFFGGAPQSTPRPTTRRPQAPSTLPTLPPAQPSRAQPSRCVWAIISCCQGNTQNISYSCFEQLGCSGPFWDKSPCDSDFAKAAVNLALQYYSQK